MQVLVCRQNNLLSEVISRETSHTMTGADVPTSPVLFRQVSIRAWILEHS
jgi:hypothetical protein